ncbi:hypothetical protein niasHT_039362 [Heterodera trifolii]|uniref:Uncharacterized protein n=1 Tax=Heterodera trifolii TaxID=157864 RepID=A0ABD2IMU9_9BILA
MCETGKKFMGMFGSEPNEEAQQNVIGHIKKLNDRSMGNKHIQNGLEKLLGILFMATNDYINGMMKKMDNHDKLKQFLVQDTCDEAKLKLKKVDKIYKIVGKIGKIDIGESSKEKNESANID